MYSKLSNADRWRHSYSVIHPNFKNTIKNELFSVTALIRFLCEDTYDVKVYLILKLLVFLMWVLLTCVVQSGV
jgi:hypothetical protein